MIWSISMQKLKFEIFKNPWLLSSLEYPHLYDNVNLNLKKEHGLKRLDFISDHIYLYISLISNI